MLRSSDSGRSTVTSPVVNSASRAPAEWAGFAEQRGSFYHDPRWVEALADCFRYPITCLTATADGAVQGILALAEVPGLLGPRRLVSLPFSYAAGPLAPSPLAAEALGREARAVAEARGVSLVELKRVGTDVPPPNGFERIIHYSTYRVPTEGAVWDRLDKSSTQRSIRKAERSRVEAVRGASEREWLVMARLQERSSSAHGVPAPPRRFFTATCRGLQELGLADLLLARLPDGRVAAGLVLWKGRREWIHAFGASDPATLEFRPNHLLLWTALQAAARAGVVFDLGRAAPEQAGLAEFKRRWGGQPVPLAYDYWPRARGLNAAPRDRGALALAGRIWSGLPTAVTRLGSGLYRYLG